MKIAVVCDWLVTVGGAEKVLYQILECFPSADIFSLVDFLEPEKRYMVHNKLVTTSFIQKLPFAKRRYRMYLPLMPLAIEQFDLSPYDLVISSSHAVAKGVITGPNQLHICYCHSPMRYAWDLQHQYLMESNLNKGIKSWVARYVLHKMRIWDNRTSNGVNEFIANSNFVASRIYKIYRRNSTVIYPPVEEITNNSNHLNVCVGESVSGDYYITASRLVPYKRIDLIIDAFIKTPQRTLIVIGSGPDLNKLITKARGFLNIKILGYQSDQNLYNYLANARAFIFTAVEDFGILPVEAQMLGVPVIAYGNGGVVESVIDYNKDAENATGILFTKQNVEGVLSAVERFELIADKIKSDNCRKNAKRFASSNFRFVFKKFVLDAYDKWTQNWVQNGQMEAK